MPKNHQHTPLESVRLIEPRNERELMLFTAAFMWLATAVAILMASLVIPDLVPHDRLFWSIVLTGTAVISAVSHLTWMRRLDQQWMHITVNVWCVISVFCYVVCLQVSPKANEAIYLAMLTPAIYAAHFLSQRNAAVQVGLLSTAAMVSAIVSDHRHQGTSMIAIVTVFVIVMWSISAAVSLLKGDRQQALGEAERHAYSDPLTGLPNLRALRARADEFTNPRHAKFGRSVALLLIDLDNFKQANTLHGHNGGDHVLRTIAQGLKHAAGPTHLVSRVGGDEFAVLIDDVNPIDLPNLAIRYRRAVQSVHSRAGLPGITIDASVGAAITGANISTLEDLLTAADRAMYAVKEEHGHSTAVRRNSESANPTPKQFGSKSIAPTWVSPESPPEAPRPVGEMIWRDRPLHTRFAFGTWAIGTTAILISLALPGSDHAHLKTALIALAVGYLISIFCYFNAPVIGTWEHVVGDVVTLSSIAFIAYLTGGSQSPASVLVYLFIIYEAWFLSATAIWLRLLGPIAVILLPLTYENLSSLDNPTGSAAALYAGVGVALGLTLAMSYDQYFLERARRVTARLATVDPLTGLWNRREFERRVTSELDGLGYNAHDELAIVMLDLDDFKAVNTAHGHRAGDEILSQIGTALAEVARVDDCVARVGGDEFAIVLPGVDAAGASDLARRFVEAVTTRTANSEHHACRNVGASAGFALYPIHGRSLDDLTSAADLALMSVKSGAKGSARVSEFVVAL